MMRGRRKWSGLVAGSIGTVLLMISLLPVSNKGFIAAAAEADSPYKISEFAVRVAPGAQYDQVIGGKWILWREQPVFSQTPQTQIAGRNLETGLDFGFYAGGALQGTMDIDGNTVVTVEAFGGPGIGVFAYELPDAQRVEVAPYKAGVSRQWPRIGGKVVVWTESMPQGGGPNADIYGYDLGSRRLFPITTHPAHQDRPDVSGNYVVWRDNRFAPPVTPGVPIAGGQDIFGLDLSSGQEFRITAQSGLVGPPAVGGSVVVWGAQHPEAVYLLGYDIPGRRQFTIARLPADSPPVHPEIDGDLVVWASEGEVDYDIFGFDLKLGKQFIISRAVGDQTMPKISGKNVVWGDGRGSGVGKYEIDPDTYGARLEPGAAPPPPPAGIPKMVDAKIEIVWPHGGAAVTEADKANVGAWLFNTSTLDLAACQWRPQVQLWRALNNEPAKVVALGSMQGDRYIAHGRGVPTWEFNDVDVSAARDPQNKLYFFVTVDGTPTRTNIWSHGADARTHFPKQDVPAGIRAMGDAVEARIQIVWPHDNAPVREARLANIGAALFAPGTLLSVPPEWNGTVRLYRSLNTGVAEEVAVGQKQLVQRPGFTYPLWTFDDVDVSAANDPANKYYFAIVVDGVTTYTNVWAHGDDARTHFPKMDEPTASCRGS